MNKPRAQEKFFVSYAVRGPVLIPGTRQDLPLLTPLPGPVKEPSPLNTRWKSTRKEPTLVGIC